MANIGRPTYSGMLQFGTVMAAVKIIKGTQEIDSDVKVNLMHAGCGGAIKKPSHCEKCDTDVAYGDLGRSIEGRPIDQEVLDSFKVASDKVIDIQAVVPFTEIDTRLFDVPRYMVPDKGAETAVRAIRDGLTRMKKPHAGVGKIAKEDKEVVVAVYVKDGALVIHDLRWPEEIREAGPYAATVDEGKLVNEKLSKGVDTLLANMIEKFDATQFVDEKGRLRAEALRAIAAGTPVAGAMPFEVAQPKDDLLAQIEASIEAAQKRKAAMAS